MTACVRQTRTGSASPPPAVTTTMQRQVQNAVYAGEGDPEIRLLRKRLASNANDLDTRILLARLYARRNLPDLALEHYRLALALFPDSNVAALGLAETLRFMGESREALKAAGTFVERHPDASWELLSLEGILQDDLGELTAAEASYRAALAREPNRSSLLNNLGYNLLLQGKAEEAAAEFRRAIEIDPHSEIAHNNLAAALAAQSRPREALAEWQRISDPATAHNNLAAVLIEQGRYAEARSELDAALALRRDFPAALANLALVAEKDGNPATTPPPKPRVNFWKRVTSTVGTILGASKPAPDRSPGPASGIGEGK
jgi:tetratricopeptide (TPR) repeat protein